MSVRLVTIASFGQPEDAYLARNQLERAGIPAVIVDASSAGTMWYFGAATGGAKLQVSEDDAQRAREFLLDVVSDPDRHDLAGYWRCLSCQEIVDPGFDICWSCSSPKEEMQDKTFQPTLAQVVESPSESDPPDTPLILMRPSAEAAGEFHDNPYSPSCVQASSARPPLDVAAPRNMDELVIRAWRASVIGALVCPPILNVYSMYLLIWVSLKGPYLSAKVNRRFYAALVINILVGLAVGCYRWFQWARP